MLKPAPLMLSSCQGSFFLLLCYRIEHFNCKKHVLATVFAMCIFNWKVCQSLSFEIFSFFPIIVFFSQISYCRSLIKEENLDLLLISDGRLWLIKLTQTPRTPHCSVTQSNRLVLLFLPLLSWDLSALCFKCDQCPPVYCRKSQVHC